MTDLIKIDREEKDAGLTLRCVGGTSLAKLAECLSQAKILHTEVVEKTRKSANYCVEYTLNIAVVAVEVINQRC
jgi:ribosomal protein S26